MPTASKTEEITFGGVPCDFSNMKYVSWFKGWEALTTQSL